jgi:hypothetical protein
MKLILCLQLPFNVRFLNDRIIHHHFIVYLENYHENDSLMFNFFLGSGININSRLWYCDSDNR